MKKMAYKDLVAECKRLRSEFEKAEARFFAWLMVVEREHEAVWKGAGCATFAQFLTSNDLTKDYRYRDFARGVDHVGLDTALQNGAHWTIRMGSMADTATKEQADKFSTLAQAFVDVHGVAPSDETISKWVSEVRGAPDRPKIVRRADELHRLRAENLELKAKLRAAEKKLEELRAELRKARHAKTKGDGGASATA